MKAQQGEVDANAKAHEFEEALANKVEFDEVAETVEAAEAEAKRHEAARLTTERSRFQAVTDLQQLQDMFQQERDGLEQELEEMENNWRRTTMERDAAHDARERRLREEIAQADAAARQMEHDMSNIRDQVYFLERVRENLRSEIVRYGGNIVGDDGEVEREIFDSARWDEAGQAEREGRRMHYDEMHEGRDELNPLREDWPPQYQPGNPIDIGARDTTTVRRELQLATLARDNPRSIAQNLGALMLENGEVAGEAFDAEHWQAAGELERTTGGFSHYTSSPSPPGPPSELLPRENWPLMYQPFQIPDIQRVIGDRAWHFPIGSERQYAHLVQWLQHFDGIVIFDQETPTIRSRTPDARPPGPQPPRPPQPPPPGSSSSDRQGSGYSQPQGHEGASDRQGEGSRDDGGGARSGEDRKLGSIEGVVRVIMDQVNQRWITSPIMALPMMTIILTWVV